jgi:protein phosphatase-4 regulatory subunit 3
LRGAVTQGIVAALTILDHPETPELSLQQHLDLAPDLVGYGSQLAATGDEPQSSMMAQPVPHQDKKRVKVYELRNNDWFDRGTGFCTAKFATVCLRPFLHAFGLPLSCCSTLLLPLCLALFI